MFHLQKSSIFVVILLTHVDISVGLFCWTGMYECCNDKWIPANYADLATTLNDKLYGQHLVIEPVVKNLKAHGKNKPSKALAFSFHGSTGTGKTYVSRIIAEKLYWMGMKSKYVHFFSAEKDFRHQGKVDDYKEIVKNKLETSVKKCARSLFIFDEIDKMLPGILDILKPYLDYHDNLDGVDYKKATFIFLSNTAAIEITERTLNHWRKGLSREDICREEMEGVIRHHALNEDTYIPFLPLERRHIKQCIRDSLRGNYKDEAIVQEIADELRYYPADVLIFAVNGCKRVPEKTALYLLEEI